MRALRLGGNALRVGTRFHLVFPFLRGLGYSTAQAQRGAGLCDALPNAPLEARIRFALDALGPDPERITLHCADRSPAFVAPEVT